MRRQHSSILLATTFMAALAASLPLHAQTHEGPAPARGGRGGGSMYIGEGIDQSNQPTLERETPSRDSDAPAPEPEPGRSDGTPGHGGNETDMEHRQRPHLER